MMANMLRVVVDTNVLFEGVTQEGGAAGLVIEGWLANLFEVCISTSLAFEYVDVLSRKLSPKRWDNLKSLIGTLMENAEYVPIYYTWRPISSDKGDEHIIDCAMNANAILVTHNVKDFQTARKSLGLQVMPPLEFIKYYLKDTEEEEE